MRDGSAWRPASAGWHRWQSCLLDRERCGIAGHAVVAAAAGRAGTRHGVRRTGRRQRRAIEVIPVRENIYVFSGAPAPTSSLSVGRDGVFLVDTGARAECRADARGARAAAEADRLQDAAGGTFGRRGKLLDAARAVLPERAAQTDPLFANTTFAPDHIGGNAKVAAAGKTFTGGNVAGEIDVASEGAAILGYEKLLDRMGQAKLPTQALPTETYFGDHMKLSHFFNGEGVVLYHAPAATTDGDSIVNFRRSDVFATGDCSGCRRFRRSISRRAAAFRVCSRR